MRYVDILAYLREMANAQSINFVCPITVKLALIVEVVDQKGPSFSSSPLFLGQKSFIREYTRDSHILSSLASFCSGCTDSRRTCRQCCKEKFGICIHRWWSCHPFTSSALRKLSFYQLCFKKIVFLTAVLQVNFLFTSLVPQPQSGGDPVYFLPAVLK